MKFVVMGNVIIQMVDLLNFHAHESTFIGLPDRGFSK